MRIRSAPPGVLVRLAALVVVALSTGCWSISTYLSYVGIPSSEQTQYFAAVNPETASLSFYKVTIAGRGPMFSDYELRAGYFNAATLDAITGSFSDPPEVAADDQQLASIRRLRATLYAELEQMSTESTGAPSERISQITWALWLASLDPFSLNSIGMTKSTDPYSFQKLVFWAESKSIDFQQMTAQFENTLKNTFAVIKRVRGAKAEEAAAMSDARDASNAAIGHLIDSLKLRLVDNGAAIIVLESLEQAVGHRNVDAGVDQALALSLLTSIEPMIATDDSVSLQLLEALRRALGGGVS